MPIDSEMIIVTTVLAAIARYLLGVSQPSSVLQHAAKLDTKVHTLRMPADRATGIGAMARSSKHLPI